MKQSRKKDNRSYAEKKAAFWGSIFSERLKDVREGLVNTGMEAQTRNEDGLTSIMVAALNGKAKSLDVLLDYYERRRELRRKGWIDLRDDNGRTALMMGAAAGRIEVVETLLLKDAKAELKDNDGLTARDHAEKKSKADVVKFMDDWFHESEEELVEDEHGNVVNDGLTSTQRSKLKKRQMQALETRGKAKKDDGKGEDDEDDEDNGEPGPKPIWAEVAKVVESVEMLRPIHEITVVKETPEESLPGGIDPALWYLRSINRLDLRLGPGFLTSIPGNGLGRLKKLTTLILNDNALTSLPEEISKLSNLKVLEVARNKLTSLPASLAKCSSLDVLDFSFNQLTDLSALEGLKNLGTINVSENKLTSLELPYEDLSRLHDLIASGNQIEDLPAEFGLLVGLTDVNLENNKITELPVEITELKKIKVLKMEGNPIKDQKVVKMLKSDQRKDLWKYLQKVGGSGKKGGKKGGKSKKKKGKGDDDEDDDSAKPPVPPSQDNDDEEGDGYFTDDSFDITMEEL